MRESKQYQVEKLDLKGRKAFVKAVDADYFTDAMTASGVSILVASSPGRPRNA